MQKFTDLAPAVALAEKMADTFGHRYYVTERGKEFRVIRRTQYCTKRVVFVAVPAKGVKDLSEARDKADEKHAMTGRHYDVVSTTNGRYKVLCRHPRNNRSLAYTTLRTPQRMSAWELSDPIKQTAAKYGVSVSCVEEWRRNLINKIVHMEEVLETMTVRQYAEKIGVHFTTVYRSMRNNNIPTPRQRTSK